MSTFGTLVVEIGGVDVDDPVPINATFVCAIRTIERCLVRQLTLGVVVGGNHYKTYGMYRDNDAVVHPILAYLRKRLI